MSFLTLMLDNKQLQKIAKNEHVNFDMQIKNRIIIRYCFTSINIFQCVRMYILFDIRDLQTKNSRRYVKKAPQGIHLNKGILGRRLFLLLLLLFLLEALGELGDGSEASRAALTGAEKHISRRITQP